MRHLSEAQIERVVMGSEDLSQDDRLHLAGCSQCSDALRREAALELALHAAVELPHKAARSVEQRAVGRTLPWRVFAAAAAVLVVLTAAALWKRQMPRAVPSGTAQVYRAMAPESLVLAPGFREPQGLEPGEGTASLSMIGRDVIVETGELVMIE